PVPCHRALPPSPPFPAPPPPFPPLSGSTPFRTPPVAGGKDSPPNRQTVYSITTLFPTKGKFQGRLHVMRLNPRSSAVVAGVVLALTLLAASGAVLAAPTGTVHFYTSMQLEVVEPLIKEIEAMYPGLKIDLL